MKFKDWFRSFKKDLQKISGIQIGQDDHAIIYILWQEDLAPQDAAKSFVFGMNEVRNYKKEVKL